MICNHTILSIALVNKTSIEIKAASVSIFGSFKSSDYKYLHTYILKYNIFQYYIKILLML